MLIDTHCHLNFGTFKDDANRVIQKTLNDDVWMIIVGTNYELSRRACELSSGFSNGVFASVGLHPLHCFKSKVNEGGHSFVTKGEIFDVKKYRDIVLEFRSYKKTFLFGVFKKQRRPIIVAIGECGLDYSYHPDSNVLSIQRRIFCEQIDLACSFDLPLIVHARGVLGDSEKVYNDLISFLQEKKIMYGDRLRGVIHSFTGTLRSAELLNELGFYIGINALVLQNSELSKTVKSIPIDYLLFETDSPYFYPGADGSTFLRNEPVNVKRVLEYVAIIRNINIYTLSTQTTKNARALFNIA